MENELKEEMPNMPVTYEVDRVMLDRVINFLIEQAEYSKNILEEQRSSMLSLLSEYEDLADKYENLFTTMLMEDDTAGLRQEIIRLKESLSLTESLMDFSDNKNQKGK